MQNACIDLARAEALAVSIATLLAAGLDRQARPLADELAAMLKAARGPLAEVIPMWGREPKG